MFRVIPPGLKTIHSDAWRDVGASWETYTGVGTGFIPWESEQFCGQVMLVTVVWDTFVGF